MDVFRCSKCGQDKPRDGFYKSSVSSSGLQSQCKLCTAIRKGNKKPFSRVGKTVEERNANKKAFAKAWRDQHREHLRDKLYAWRSENHERYSAINYRSRRKNIDRVLAHNKARVKRVRQATPPWADTSLLLDIYRLAHVLTKFSGVSFEVDHEIPLQGKRVCGLHVQNNVRLLTRLENARKGNCFEEA